MSDLIAAVSRSRQSYVAVLDVTPHLTSALLTQNSSVHYVERCSCNELTLSFRTLLSFLF